MLNGGTNPVSGPDCIGFNASVNPLRIQNQGTQNVTLNISFNATATTFIGGTTPVFSFRATWNETGTCGMGTDLNNISTSVSAANTNFSICNSSGFNWVSGNRTLNIDLGIKIPQDAPPGARTVLVTAYASP